ncbi:MAG: Hsp20/alpha crystallin family protein [Burkholderiaceae bacterium]
MAQNLMRFDPFGDLMRVDPFRGIDDVFREFAMLPSLRSASALEPMSRIRMDISETDKNYEIKADIPGVKKEDIKVAVDRNQVTISAEVKEEKEESQKSGAGMVRSERYYGQMYRSFVLPQEVDDAAAEAKYENGVLMLSLPKKADGGGAKQLAIH